MGTGFIEYLNDYRLTIAGQKLKNSSDSVLTIAEECGFEHLSYFNRLFKRKYGTTPENTEAAYTEAASVFPVFLTLLFLSMRNVLRMII